MKICMHYIRGGGLESISVNNGIFWGICIGIGKNNNIKVSVLYYLRRWNKGLSGFIFLGISETSADLSFIRAELSIDYFVHRFQGRHRTSLQHKISQHNLKLRVASIPKCDEKVNYITLNKILTNKLKITN